MDRLAGVKAETIMTAQVRSLDADATLEDAMREMDRLDVRHLPVVADGELVGVLSDRDLLEATGWQVDVARERGHGTIPSVENLISGPPQVAGPKDDARVLAGKLAGARIGCLPIVDHGALVGLVTETDVLAAFRDACGEGAATEAHDPPIGDCMTRGVTAVAPDATAWEAARLLRSGHMRHLPVVDEERLVGVLSDRDLRRSAGRGDFGGAVVADLMSRDPVSVAPTDRLSRAAALFTELGMGCLPVLEGETLCGVLSVSDVLALCATDWPRVG